jgi:GNAT superfamily N-acetyltransferase
VPAALEAVRRPEDFLRRTPPRLLTTTVATVEEQIVGFVTVHDDEVEQVYVATEARGSGVAATLLHHAEQQIPGTAWLAVVAGNARARRFYERQGWVDAGAFDYPADDVVVRSHRYEKAKG